MIERKDLDGIRTLKLAHGKVSAMDVELGEALIDAFKAAQDDSIRAVILTGSGSSFSAGVDLFRVLDGGPDYVRRFLPVLDDFLRRVLTFPKPVIAAINGHAIAGGCILAAACDHRIMIDGSGRIGIPELAVGVPFPALPMGIVAARVQDGALRDLVLTGRMVQADEAKSIGLIDEKCPDGMLMDRAHDLAHKYAAIPSTAFALTKEAFFTPILKRAEQSADLNVRVAQEWMQPHTYEAIRLYLQKTIKK